MGVIPNPKMAFIFPISCILALIFPILLKYFPKCVGKGSFPKSQIKSLYIVEKQPGVTFPGIFCKSNSSKRRYRKFCKKCAMLEDYFCYCKTVGLCTSNQSC